MRRIACYVLCALSGLLDNPSNTNDTNSGHCFQPPSKQNMSSAGGGGGGGSAASAYRVQQLQQQQKQLQHQLQQHLQQQQQQQQQHRSSPAHVLRGHHRSGASSVTFGLGPAPSSTGRGLLQRQFSTSDDSPNFVNRPAALRQQILNDQQPQPQQQRQPKPSYFSRSIEHHHGNVPLDGDAHHRTNSCPIRRRRRNNNEDHQTDLGGVPRASPPTRQTSGLASKDPPKRSPKSRPPPLNIRWRAQPQASEDTEYSICSSPSPPRSLSSPSPPSSPSPGRSYSGASPSRSPHAATSPRSPISRVKQQQLRGGGLTPVGSSGSGEHYFCLPPLSPIPHSPSSGSPRRIPPSSSSPARSPSPRGPPRSPCSASGRSPPPFHSPCPSPSGYRSPSPIAPPQQGRLARLASRRRSNAVVSTNRRTSNFLELPGEKGKAYHKTTFVNPSLPLPFATSGRLRAPAPASLLQPSRARLQSPPPPEVQRALPSQDLLHLTEGGPHQARGSDRVKEAQVVRGVGGKLQVKHIKGEMISRRGVCK